MYDEVTDVPASNDVESEPLYQASVWLWKIGFPVILAAGTFGNVMVIVMHRRLAATQDSSISVYFTALAVSDLLSLWFDPVFWCLQAFGFTVVNDGVCKVRVFLAYLTGHTSAAILVAMTFQRAASILWPHRVNDMCNHGTARVVTCLVYLLLVVLNAHILFGHRMEPTDTQPEAVCFYGYVASDYEIFFRHVWGWIDTLLCAILPFFLLLASNAVLIHKVAQSLRRARSKLSAGSADQFGSREKAVVSMTITLISISVAFFVLVLPVSVYLMLEETFSQGAEEDVSVKAANELVMAMGSILWHTSNAINFYVYCLTGVKYREEFMNLVCRKQKGRSRPKVFSTISTVT